MSTKWGTDLSGIPPSLLSATASADVTCTADTEVTAMSPGGVATALAQVTNQDFVALIQGVATFVFSATPPTSLVISYCLVLGTPIDSFTVEPGLLVATTELIVPFVLSGPSSSSLFAGAGAAPLIDVISAGNDSTMKAVGSRAFFQLIIGND